MLVEFLENGFMSIYKILICGRENDSGQTSSIHTNYSFKILLDHDQ